jgi:DNA-binding Xre family transcriptional regulator
MYVDDVASNVGTMFEYAVACGFNPSVFWSKFIYSIVAEQIEKGNPKYLTGYSGRDYVDIIINTAPIKKIKKSNDRLYTGNVIINKDEFYWAGWALAQYQHKKGMSFYNINKYLDIKVVLNLYHILHEADITKFYDVADTYVKQTKQETNLKTIRTVSGLSQSELAKESGVELRSIQMYEQRKNDINKAQVETLLKLSKVLGCDITDLLEYN